MEVFLNCRFAITFIIQIGFLSYVFYQLHNGCFMVQVGFVANLFWLKGIIFDLHALRKSELKFFVRDNFYFLSKTKVLQKTEMNPRILLKIVKHGIITNAPLR